ncbi:MAG: SH3 domain-containing protein [Bacilli bacterium]
MLFKKNVASRLKMALPVALLLSLLISLLGPLPQVAASKYAEFTYNPARIGIVTSVPSGGLHVYATASTSAKKEISIKKNDKLKVVKKASTGWYYVEYSGKKGWVPVKHVKLDGKWVNAAEFTYKPSRLGKVDSVPSNGATYLYKGSYDGSDKLETLKVGDTMKVIKKRSTGYYYVERNGKIGWVKMKYLNIDEKYPTTTEPNPEPNPDPDPTPPPTTDEENYSPARTGYVKNVNAYSYLNVRKSATSSSEIVGKLHTNTPVSVTKRKGDWYYITSGKLTGWVTQSYLAFSKPSISDGVAIVSAKPYANIYTDTTWRNGFTYASTNAEMKLLSYNSTWMKVQIADYVGYVKPEDVKIVSYSQLQDRSYYSVRSGELYHYYYNWESKSYSSSLVGAAPSALREGQKYYSLNGKTFYDEIYKKSFGTLVTTWKNPYMFTTIKGKTSLTATQLNNYIKQAKPESPLYKEYTDKAGKKRTFGSDLKDAEAKHNINAEAMLAFAMHESNFGTSTIAKEKKNLFGFQAYDVDPEGNAKAYDTYYDSLIDVINHLEKNYINPPNGSTIPGKYYYGDFFGNKGEGMNVKYASDAYWGEKISGHWYRLKKAVK